MKNIKIWVDVNREIRWFEIIFEENYFSIYDSDGVKRDLFQSPLEIPQKWGYGYYTSYEDILERVNSKSIIDLFKIDLTK